MSIKTKLPLLILLSIQDSIRSQFNFGYLENGAIVFEYAHIFTDPLFSNFQVGQYLCRHTILGHLRNSNYEKMAALDFSRFQHEMSITFSFPLCRQYASQAKRKTCRDSSLLEGIWFGGR